MASGPGFPKSADVGKLIDKAKGAQREVIGAKLDRPAITARPNSGGVSYGKGVSGPRLQDESSRAQITAPATELAKAWTGWAFALKPAWNRSSWP